MLAFVGFGGLQAETLSYSPLHPRGGDSVNFTISTFNCGALLDTAFAPPGAGNGSIRFTITQACNCVATPPPIVLNEAVGPLAAGAYDITLYQQFRDEGGACCEGGCSPPDLLLTSALTVSDPTLSLRQGRFRVSAEWRAPGIGQGIAQGVPLTDESGYFTFFGLTNVELVAKVLNGCPVNQRYWIFLAGMTNVGVTVQVEDTLTGRRETYVNPLGQAFQPVLDTSTFATCP